MNMPAARHQYFVCCQMMNVESHLVKFVQYKVRLRDLERTVCKFAALAKDIALHMFLIRLRGRKTNYFGIGAMIHVLAVNAHNEEITRYYYMDNKTGFGGGPLLAHIGLADAVRIKEVVVIWPVSGCKAKHQANLVQLNVLDEEQCFIRWRGSVTETAYCNADNFLVGEGDSRLVIATAQMLRSGRESPP